MKRLFACTLALCAALSHQLQAQRSELLLEKGWRFTRQDQASFSTPDYNDSKVEPCHRPPRLGDLRAL